MTTPDPTCTCTKWHDVRGFYAPDCEKHRHYRCIVDRCMDPASEGHECVRHGRWRRSTGERRWDHEDGMADQLADFYERNVLGL